MPITWNAENEAKMMAAILSVAEVKLSEAQKAEVARRMGSGCTAKAISHRLQKLKQAAPAGSEDGEEVAMPKAKRVKTSKKKKSASPAAGGDDEDFLLTPPASGKGKKRGIEGEVKAEPGEDDGEIQVGEDIGEGLRAVSSEFEELV